MGWALRPESGLHPRTVLILVFALLGESGNKCLPLLYLSAEGASFAIAPLAESANHRQADARIAIVTRRARARCTGSARCRAGTADQRDIRRGLGGRRIIHGIRNPLKPLTVELADAFAAVRARQGPQDPGCNGMPGARQA